jgi:hypothetical protein
MEIRFENNEKEVTVILGDDNIGLCAEDCGEMAFRDYPGPLVDILDRNETELSPEQERELENLCLEFYQANREIAVKEECGNIYLWRGLEKEWLAMPDYDKAGHYIESYPDTTLNDEQIVSRLTYVYTN